MCTHTHTHTYIRTNIYMYIGTSTYTHACIIHVDTQIFKRAQGKACVCVHCPLATATAQGKPDRREAGFCLWSPCELQEVGVYSCCRFLSLCTLHNVIASRGESIGIAGSLLSIPMAYGMWSSHNYMSDGNANWTGNRLYAWTCWDVRDSGQEEKQQRFMHHSEVLSVPHCLLQFSWKSTSLNSNIGSASIIS